MRTAAQMIFTPNVEKIFADERNRRVEAFNSAKASIALEGFFVSDELEILAQSFIDGEIEFSELTKCVQKISFEITSKLQVESKKMTIDEYFDLPKQEKEKIFARATKAAITRAHALGLATTHGDGKGIFKLYPDGHKEYTRFYIKEELND